jgi:8-amino-7-oxononanoate synthase
MVDFTSSLYLGLRHASASLRPWAQLTTGVPAALAEPQMSGVLARRLARLTGTQDGMVARSTLHASFDAISLSAERGTAIYIDTGSYPVARWAAERAAAFGTPLRSFPHHDPVAVERLVAAGATSRLRPVVLTDGLCGGCGQPAPLTAYLSAVRRFGGLLIIDDTQGLGVLGARQPQGNALGMGGGGVLRWANLEGHDVLLIDSLAKAFGAPLAFIGGSHQRIDLYRERGETRMHSSPPSYADTHAATRALDLNETEGERRRAWLAQLATSFQHGLRRLGVTACPLPSPIQTLRPIRGAAATELHRRLGLAGIRAVLHSSCDSTVRVSFIINATHTASQIERALTAVEDALSGPRRPLTRAA